MKRTYTKPVLVYENFTLMDAIANCSGDGLMVLQKMDYLSCSAWNSDFEEMWLMSSAVGCDQVLDDHIMGQYSTSLS